MITITWEDLEEHKNDLKEWLKNIRQAEWEKNISQAGDEISRKAALDLAKDINVPANDCISRQAVKDWLQRWNGYIDADTIARMQYRVVDIPSAQTEIVRCKDCIHWKDFACMKTCAVFDWQSTENDFCSFAERRKE